jgi:hypothetical protein
VPAAEVHVLEAGHFALDTAADRIAQLVRDFMNGVPALNASRGEDSGRSGKTVARKWVL